MLGREQHGLLILVACARDGWVDGAVRCMAAEQMGSAQFLARRTNRRQWRQWSRRLAAAAARSGIDTCDPARSPASSLPLRRKVVMAARPALTALPSPDDRSPAAARCLYLE